MFDLCSHHKRKPLYLKEHNQNSALAHSAVTNDLYGLHLYFSQAFKDLDNMYLLLLVLVHLIAYLSALPWVFLAYYVEFFLSKYLYDLHLYFSPLFKDSDNMYLLLLYFFFLYSI